MNKKLVKALSIVLSAMMIFSFSVTGFAASSDVEVSIRVEGLTKCLAEKEIDVATASTVKDIITAGNIDAILAEDGITINSVKGESAVEGSKWQYAIDGKIVTETIDAYVVEKDIELVIFNASENAVMPSYKTDDLATGGVIEFIGTDKNGTEAPIEGATITWEVADSTQDYLTDKNGKIYLGIDALEKGDHDVQIKRVNADKIPTVVRFADDMEIEVPKIEEGDGSSKSFFENVYDFFYSIFKGVVEVWAFYIKAILSLFGVSSEA